MQNKKFLVNSSAVFFDDRIDSKNGWQTIVCNPKSFDYIRIGPREYRILRTLEEEPGLNFSQIAFKAGVGEDATRKFLQQMIEQNVILTE